MDALETKILEFLGTTGKTSIQIYEAVGDRTMKNVIATLTSLRQQGLVRYVIEGNSIVYVRSPILGISEPNNIQPNPGE